MEALSRLSFCPAFGVTDVHPCCGICSSFDSVGNSVGSWVPPRVLPRVQEGSLRKGGIEC